MPNSCAVLGCKNRQSKTLRLYRFPAICKKPKFKELSLIRRNRWLTALQRDDINEKNARVCAVHFISGASAPLKDMYNPDWVPTLKMGSLLYPKRQKYSSNAERKEHAFADLFELIGDGETNTDKSTNDDNQESEEEKEQSQDHNYSRNLFIETFKENSEEDEPNINEPINSFQEMDLCDTIGDRFTQSNIIIYDKPEQNVNQSSNADIDIDVVTCDTIDRFNRPHNSNEPDKNLNQPINIYSEGDRFKNTDENESDQNSRVITIFHSEGNHDNYQSTNKFNQTIKDESNENLNGKVFYYAEVHAGNCDSIYKIKEIDEYNENEGDNIFCKIDAKGIDIIDSTFNQIDQKNPQIQEHNYSNKSNLNSEIENLIDCTNHDVEHIANDETQYNLNYNNNMEINTIADNNKDLEEIILFNPEPIFNDIGTQTYMSNNMFEYLVTEIAKKNLIIQQKSSIIAEKDKKIGKLKLKLHKLRLEIYNSEVNRRKTTSK